MQGDGPSALGGSYFPLIQADFFEVRQIIEYISDNSENTLIIIPTDDLFHSTLKMINDYDPLLKVIMVTLFIFIPFWTSSFI